MKERCVLCDSEFDDNNRSPEHIIPQAIGGRVIVENFICKSCNHSTGGKWDKDLAEQLASLSVLLGTKRQRKAPPPVIVRNQNGDELKVFHDGSMTSVLRSSPVERIDYDSGIRSVEIRSETQQKAEKISANYRKKLEKMGAKDIRFTSNEIVSDFIGPVHISMSPDLDKSGFSLVKTALAFAVHCGISPGACDLAIDYLLNLGVQCLGYYYSADKDVVINRPSGEIFHCVAIQSASNDGCLWAYIEYYTVFRVMICLSKIYSGEPVNACHAIDPRTGKAFDLSVNVDSTTIDFDELQANTYCNTSVMEVALANLQPIIYRHSVNQSLKRYIASAYKRILKEMGLEEDTDLTTQQMREFSGRLAEAMRDFYFKEQNG
jgi:hypothetical protein